MVSDSRLFLTVRGKKMTLVPEKEGLTSELLAP